MDEIMEEVARRANEERGRRFAAGWAGSDDLALLRAQFNRRVAELQYQSGTDDSSVTPEDAALAEGGYSAELLEPLRWDVKVDLRGETAIQAHSFAECSKGLRGTAEVPVSCEVRLGDWGNCLKMEIKSSLFADALEVEADPSVPLADDFLAAVSEWAMRHQCAAVVRAWAAAARVWPVPIFLLLTVSLVAAFGSMLQGTRVAEAMLQDGISELEVPAAVELLIRHEFGLWPTSPASSSPFAYAWMTIVVVVALLSFVRPRTVLELNTAGAKALRFRTKWVNFWTWAAPVWIVLALLAIVLKSWLEPTLRGP